MKKLINIRLPAILACALTAGVFLGYRFALNDISLFCVIAVVPVTAVILIFCAVYLKNGYKLLFPFLTALFIALGAINCYMRICAFTESDITDGGFYNISATVSDKGESAAGEYLILKNAYADGVRLDGKIIVRLSGNYGDFCDVGYKISFSSPVYKNDAFQYGKLYYLAQDNVKYTCRVNGGITSKHGRSFFGGIRSALRGALYDNLDKDTAAIAYAMLTGCTQDIDESSMSAFRYGGIAHIFAVSGLHIGIVYAVTAYLAKKLKLNKYAAAVLCISTAFFYSGVCGFAVSSVRAAVMCASATLTRLIHKKYDGLNSLSLAVLVLLLVYPLSLFSVGFKLSVCAAGGIILLSKNLARAMKKLPDKLRAPLAVSLAAQVSTAPVMLSSFGYLSIAGIFLNPVFIPLFSVIYVLMLVSAIFCAVLPFAAPYVLPYAALPLEVIVSFLLNAGFEKALLSGFGAGAFTAIYFVGLLALSDKINIRPFKRFVAAGIISGLLVTYALVGTFAPFVGYKIIVSAHYGGGEVLIKSRGENVLILTDAINNAHARSTVNGYSATELAAVIILCGESSADGINSIGLNCRDAYVYYQNPNVQPYDKITVHYEKTFEVGGAVYEFESGNALTVKLGGIKVGICSYGAVADYCNILISDNYTDKTVCEIQSAFNERNIGRNVYDCGDIKFYVNNGKIKKAGL